MTKACFIGIDQGSSSTKTLAVTDDGQVLARARRDLSPPGRTGGRVEQDPLEILASVLEALDETMQALQASAAVPRGLGLACQRSSCLAWDEAAGEPLTPVLSWRDTRGLPVVQELSEQAPSIFEATGLPLTPYYSASKLRWLKDSSPAAGRGRAVFGTLSSFLAQRLTAAPRAIIDHTNAARTQLMNIKTLAWDARLAELFGLRGVRLPGIAPVLGEWGAVRTSAGALPLLACVGDQQAAMLGLGVVGKGDGGINYGTGGFLVVNTGKDFVPARDLMASVHYSTGRETVYLLEGSVNAVGDALDWLKGLGLYSGYAELDGLCRRAASDVVVFIGLNGTGAPHWESAVSSSLHGMTAASTPADIVRGAVEGIAFFMEDIVRQVAGAGLEPRAFAVSGGLSSLRYLIQAQADIAGTSMRVSREQEVSALGAALLAGMATGAWTAKDIRRLTPPAEVVAPRENAGLHRRYLRWQELHRLTKKIDAL